VQLSVFSRQRAAQGLYRDFRCKQKVSVLYKQTVSWDLVKGQIRTFWVHE
jgi:hypothetical protein